MNFGSTKKVLGLIAILLTAALIYTAANDITTSQNVSEDKFAELNEGKISGNLSMRNFSFATGVENRSEFAEHSSTFSSGSNPGRIMLYYEIADIEKREGLTKLNLAMKVTSTENETFHSVDRDLEFDIGDSDYVWLRNALGTVGVSNPTYEPGNYLVEINVTDRFSNKTIYYRKTFEVTE